MQLCSIKRIKFCICLATPFVLAPLLFSGYKEARCGYVILWMVVFWVLEPVHTTVTALLPVVLFPLLGILDAQEVASNYMKEILMMVIGILGVAIAVEHCNLHVRISLMFLSTVGANIQWLLLGFMLNTMFLSLWITNIASAAMMVPIVEAVISELRSENHDEETANHEARLKILHKTLLLGVAYSANIGGTGCITGCPSNMIFKGYIDEWYPDSPEITYASWMAYNIPNMILCVLSTWVVLQMLYMPCWHREDKQTNEKIKAVITSRYKELGRITFHESAILILFIILVSLWMFRDPKFMSGWADLLASDKKIGISTPAIGILVLMFFLPAEPWRLHKSPPLLSWKVVQQNLKWGLVLLLGGGFAMADGSQKSGLSKWMGQQMSELFSLPPAVVLLVMCLITTALTEIMTNSGVATLMIPIVNQVALASTINPLLLMLPVTIMASYAFMLPASSGVNAIIASAGVVKTADMIKTGIILNIITIGLQMFTLYTLGNHLFNLTTFPTWANSTQ